ncbi:hypothetical protein [Kribbella sp.]|uniref:hypothetical protein n=1 Tax=Kribbella sp. TaxID=1871183 RepID=UPI002D433806|nr:hypothetical protein [Kribbella sp.]HZX03883.1 hypothetical protein [Kribbella sp.]
MRNPRIRILPLNNAKFRAGAYFDLRVEAAGVDPQTARIEIKVVGSRGPVPLLQGTPERSSSAAGSLAVTYRHVAYPSAGRMIAVKVTTAPRRSRPALSTTSPYRPADGAPRT